VQKIKEEWPTVSVITVSVNGKKWLKSLFESILASNYPSNKLEIIYVDNGSTDGSIEFVKDLFKNDSRLKVIQNTKNLGWSPANNQGIKIAKGEIILCISNDMEVDPKWIEEIAKVMNSDKTIGLVQCNSLSLWDRKTPDSGMNYLDKFGYAYSYAPLKASFEVFYAEGMAFAVRQEVIKEIGVLDEYFFMEYDDMDYSWRARLAGYRIFFVPTAKVYHARGGTVGSTYFQRINNAKWYTRNHIVTLIKNYELSTVAELFPVILAMESTKILYLLLIKKNQKLAIAASKGLLQVLRDMRVIFKKRIEVQKLRKVSDKVIMKSMYPFNPWSLRLFLVLQAKGKRLVITSKTPNE
jgi:GT2 family glycosyltransferase